VIAPPTKDRRRQDVEVLGHGLPRHLQTLGELAKGLAVSRLKLVQQGPPAGIGEALKTASMLMGAICNQTVA